MGHKKVIGLSCPLDNPTNSPTTIPTSAAKGDDMNAGGAQIGKGVGGLHVLHGVSPQ